MTLDSVLALAVKAAVKMKEARAKKRDTNIHSMILCYRAGEIVAEVQPEQRQDRDAMLKCASVAAAGFDADTVVIVFESWMGYGPINPMTQAPWQPGDLNRLASEYDGIEKGWIGEVITVYAVNRAGDLRSKHLPYRIVSKNVVWQTPPEDGYDAGVVPDMLIEVMTGPSIQHLLKDSDLARKYYETDPERARAIQDREFAAMFSRHTYVHGFPRADVVLTVRKGSVAERLLRERYPVQE